MTQASDILASKGDWLILLVRRRDSDSGYYSYVCVLKFIQVIDHWLL